MKKVFMIVACAALVLACGGNSAKESECKGHKTECASEKHHGDCGDCGSECENGGSGDCTGEHQHGECAGGHGHSCNH